MLCIYNCLTVIAEYYDKLLQQITLHSLLFVLPLKLDLPEYFDYCCSMLNYKTGFDSAETITRCEQSTKCNVSIVTDT